MVVARLTSSGAVDRSVDLPHSPDLRRAPRRERCTLDHAARGQEADSKRTSSAVAIDIAPPTLARAAFG
jgi:hypothetical protein